MKAKFSDKVKIKAQLHGHKFEIGAEVQVVRVLNSGALRCSDGVETWYVHEDEVELAA